MALTRGEKQQLASLWDALAKAAIAGDVAELAALGPRAVSWASPSERPAAAHTLFALSRLAKAHSRASAGEQTRMRPALTALALLANEILAALSEALEPAPRDHAPPDPREPWWTGD